MKKLNKKGYLTIEIILGSVIAFAIAFFLIEITAKMISNNDDTFRDTIITTDNALIISGVKEVVENAGTGIIKIKCENNSCNITFSDGVNGKLYIKENKVIYEEDNVEQYIKQLDSSLTNITLDSSIKGKPDNKNNIYFKITGKNIFLDKEYSIIIPINTTIGPIGTAPTISCPKTNDNNDRAWTNEPGKGQVDVIVKDEDGDFNELCYYNYSLTSDEWDETNTVCITNENKNINNTILINNAKTNMIQVYAKDAGGNRSNLAQCATNIDTVKPFTPIVALAKNSDGTYDLSEMTNIKEITSNNCCYFYEDNHCESSSLSIQTTDNQECTISYKKLTTGKSKLIFYPDYFDQGELYDPIDNISEFVSGVSGAYRIYESCYKNGLVLATDDYLWADDNHIVQCDEKYWDKRIVTFYDKAGNQSSKLTYNSILQ